MKEAVVYFEIDVPYCSLSYGVAPCEAALGVTGAIKCFNTLATCQDLPNFTRENLVTLRFTRDSLDRDDAIEAIPCISGYSINPGTVSLGEDLGTRTSVNVTFRDLLHSDTGPGFDKYWRERGYDPYRLGTLWGKFRARQPYLRGQPARLIQGYKGQTLEEMETRYFIVESFSGPNTRGEFSISCRDILKMLDGDRAQAPVVSPGYLQSDIGAGATSATLAPAGIGNEFYPSSGLMAIGGKEIVAFTRSGNSLTITRGQEGTTAQALKAQDRCQLVLKYTAKDAADIVHDLMTEYAGVPEEYIDLAAWREETANNLQTVYTRTIPEPTPVKTLVADMIKSAALAIWWDDIERLVQFRVLKAIVDGRRLDEKAQMEGTLSYQDQPNKRISEIWTYFGVRNPLRPLTDPDNFLSVERRINSAAASLYGEDVIEKRFAPWIPQLARQTADRLNILTLGRFQDPPRLVSGAVFREGTDSPPVLGEGINIVDRFLQGPTGAPISVPVQIVRIDPKEDRVEYTGEEARWAILEEIDLTDRIITLDTNLQNINLRSIHDQIYPPLRPGDTITFVITPGALISSNSSGSPSVNVGSWPGGLVPRIEMSGLIRGAGGSGGRGANAGSSSTRGAKGSPGGTALYTRHPILLILSSSSDLWGGGGGGGGGGGTRYDRGGGGGGGGGGTRPGNGAPGGSGRERSGYGGSNGTTTSGGSGGMDGTGGQARGGRGGNPGAAGSSGQWLVSGPGSGGRAGYSIDGNSYVTLMGSGDIRGPRVN